MNETWRKRLIFALLVVTAIWGYFSITGRKARTVPVSSPALTEVTTPPPATEAEPFWDTLVANYRLRPWGNDPFYRTRLTPTTTPANDAVALRLLGILYREVGAQALINGRIIKEGDIVDGYRVTAITRDFVTMQGAGRTIELRVAKEAS